MLTRLYRYVPAVRDNFIATLEAIGDRIWIPAQAAREYLRHRYSELQDRAGRYDDALKRISDAQKLVLGAFNEPSEPAVDRKLLDALVAAFDGVRAEVTKGKHAAKKLKDEDPVFTRLEPLLNRAVAKGFSTSELDAIYLEGERRFALRIPPGYEDADKPGVERYGDLVVWKEMLNRAKEAPHRAVVLVSNDEKEDWVWIVDGRPLGPRPELGEEIATVAGVRFLMYTSEQFLKAAKKLLKVEVKNETIEAVKEEARVARVPSKWAEVPFDDPSAVEEHIRGVLGHAPEYGDSGERPEGLASLYRRVANSRHRDEARRPPVYALLKQLAFELESTRGRSCTDSEQGKIEFLARLVRTTAPALARDIGL